MSWRDLWRGRRVPMPPSVQSGARLADGRTAIVTGGAGVVGGAISRVLANEGARVAILYKSDDAKAAALVTAITAAGGEAAAWRCDISDDSSVRSAFADVAKRFGAADVLVNNAIPSPVAVGMRGFLEHSWQDYQTYIDTILKGAVLCTKAALPSMIERRFGRVINIGTASLDRVNAHLNPYVTAKGGLLGLTRSLAEEFGKHGITVNQVVPGWMWTGTDEPRGDEAALFRSLSPLHPGVATPDDVAHAVAFLVSDRARMITGAYLPVAAGLVMP